MQSPVKKNKDDIGLELLNKYPDGISDEQFKKETEELLAENEKEINDYNDKFAAFKALMLKYRPEDATDELINKKWDALSEEEYTSLMDSGDSESDFFRKQPSAEGGSKFRFTAFIKINQYVEVEADTSEEALEKLYSLDMRKYLQAKNAVQLDKQSEI